MILKSRPKRAIAERDAPEVELFCAGAGPGPGIPAMPRGGAAIVAVKVEIKLQRHPARSAGRLVDQTRARQLRAHIGAGGAKRFAINGLPALDVLRAAQLSVVK